MVTKTQVSTVYTRAKVGVRLVLWRDFYTGEYGTGVVLFTSDQYKTNQSATLLHVTPDAFLNTARMRHTRRANQTSDLGGTSKLRVSVKHPLAWPNFVTTLAGQREITSGPRSMEEILRGWEHK